MKKVYITPSIDEMVMLEEEMVCDSITVGDGSAIAGYGLSKERETVDFSDDESIW